MENKKFFRPKEAAAFLGVSRTQVYNYVARGLLPRGIKLSSRCSVWSRENLENFVEGQRAKQMADVAQ